MKYILFILLLFVLCFSCNKQDKTSEIWTTKDSNIYLSNLKNVLNDGDNKHKEIAVLNASFRCSLFRKEKHFSDDIFLRAFKIIANEYKYEINKELISTYRLALSHMKYSIEENELNKEDKIMYKDILKIIEKKDNSNLQYNKMSNDIDNLTRDCIFGR